MPKPLLRLAPLLALTVLLAGCVRVDLGIAVHDDGSGTMSIVAALDQSVLSMAEQSGQVSANPFGQIEQMPASALPPGAKVEPYKQDGFVGVRLTFPFAAGDDVARTIEQTFAAIPGAATPGAGTAAGAGVEGALGGLMGANGPLQSFVLRRQSDGGWRFSATVPTQIPTTGATGLDPTVVRTLLKNASFTVRVTLPGEVVQTNADQRNGNELVWQLDPTGAPRTLTAVTSPGSGTRNPLTIALLVVIAGAVAVGAGVIAWRH